MPSPPGYNPTALVNQTEVVRDQRLVIKKSWDLALGPLKQVWNEYDWRRPVVTFGFYVLSLDTNEPVHYVYVRQFDIYFPDHDGGHDVDSSD